MQPNLRHMSFSDRLRAMPSRPGVYLMRDDHGEVLYVGKASNLRNRIGSYFSSSSSLHPKIRNMVDKVVDFDFILTESDQEAVILECNLIKEHRPSYNVRLKDDKSYPFIKIDVSEEFPQVYITRQVSKDGARYFGPFASAGSVRRTLSLLKKLFPYRSCTKAITGTDTSPCLDYHIHRCVGPCIGAVNKKQYGEVIDQVVLFLEGKTSRIVNSISKLMMKASDSLEFEKAAVLRDQLAAIEKVNEGQKVLNLTSDNMDVIAVALDSSEAWVEVFFIRQGKLIGRDHFIMSGTCGDDRKNILTSFVKQFYDATPYIPPQILLQSPLDDVCSIQRWLTHKRLGRVHVHVPQRGQKRKLIQMVAENAVEGLEQLKIRQSSENASLDVAMIEIREALSLPRPLHRIECYDISNIQGTNSVGSMVVFENGRPKTSQYRRFKIKTVQGVDDYSMMREVLTRRFRRLSKTDGYMLSDSNSLQNKSADDDKGWGIVPDLVLIDGGRGHLGAALQVFLELGVDSIPLASLAKENEELFVPQMQESIKMPSASQGMFLVQRLRDEAHRFAITFHRQRRSKKTIGSALDMVPGVGPKRRKTLLRHFGSVQQIREASTADIAAIKGMNLKLASHIKEYL